jgi:H+/Cl- antiporter ClcA
VITYIFNVINYQLYIFSGVNTGLSSSPAAIYSAEIATPKLRGRLTCLTSLSIALGVLIIYILGYVFPVSKNRQNTKSFRQLSLIFDFFL